MVFFNNQAENSETEIILRRTAYTQEIIFQRDMSFSLLGDIVQHKYFLHQTTFCIWVAHMGSEMYGDRRNCPKHFFFSISIYRKIASSNMSCLEAHLGLFSLLMKGIFGAYVLIPFDKKLMIN